MIKIVRASGDKTTLFLEMKPSYPLTESTWFRAECASEVERNLLEVHLRTQLNERMKEIRGTLYRIGWHDKASKNRRKDVEFSPCTDLHEWEKVRGKP